MLVEEPGGGVVGGVWAVVRQLEEHRVGLEVVAVDVLKGPLGRPGGGVEVLLEGVGACLPVVPPNITRGLGVNARHLLPEPDVVVVGVSVGVTRDTTTQTVVNLFSLVALVSVAG